MDPIVSVEGISKKYSRNSSAHLSYGIRDLFTELLGRDRDQNLRKDEFWAVRDVSFELSPGDSIGLIGRNGSGKSTLLKMMNGLVKPDMGRIVIGGRVQALINLQAGFNNDLSGRDNVFNSASLMGLSRREAQEILDEVVAFAELEDFINSPVGTYSSGMKARLGFGVAVNLNPEILLIDEVLAVGDFAFQNKCFVKMQQLKKNGTTIVLVSHSHAKVVQLCERALWLHQGKFMQIGRARDTVQAYLDFMEQIEQEKLAKEKNTGKSKAAATQRRKDDQLYGPVHAEMDRVDDIECSLFVNGDEVDTVPIHSDLLIRFSFRLKEEVYDLNATVNIFRKDGLLVSAIASLKENNLGHIHTGHVYCEVQLRDFNFIPGNYVIMLPICEGRSYLYRDVVKEFFVTGSGEIFWGIVDHSYDFHVEVR
ncbi:MAG: ATP-binding cassette domain-containing protein [Candidatus Hydrogenedentes bacterium]|nr:ATP-binding cassette domain-containing protein [Candidatus Hydrogenedentota bacterium]